MKARKSLRAPSPDSVDALVESYVTWREESAAVTATVSQMV
jgi:hypothetical protein